MSNVVRGLSIVRRLASFAAALTVAVLAIATASVSASYATVPQPAAGGGALPSPLEPFPSLQTAADPTAAEMKVLTDQGISPAIARRALDLQAKVAEACLGRKIEAALGDSFAGIWFEQTKAKLYVGIASNASRNALTEAIARSGLGASVVETHVRFTVRELVATQDHWNASLATLIATSQATTGLDMEHNAVAITISSAIPFAKRQAIEGRAAATAVKSLVHVAPPSQLRLEPQAKKTCEEPFTKGKAFCEEAITAGVGISIQAQVKPTCTAGPMLIAGTETYMLTAGHCFNEAETPAAGEAFNLETTSAYRNGTQLEIGKSGTSYFNKQRDTAELRVKRPGAFTEALPTPVPALVTEWTKSAKTPHAVEGVLLAAEVIPKQTVCHEGMLSGEQCGLVLLVNVTGPRTEHLVETNACGEAGDSGGPYLFRTAAGEVLLMGTHVSGTPTCPQTATTRTKFEPLLDIPGGAGLGILATFSRQRLLKTANETRKPRTRGTKGGALTKKTYTSKSGATTFETLAGRKITCSAESGSGEASALSSGTTALNFTGCEGFFAKCKTPGAAEGEIKWSGKYSLVFINGSEDKVGTELEPAEATVECLSGGTVVEKLKTRGKALAPATPINEEVVPPKKFTLALAQTKGVQEPIEYENETGGKVRVTLETEGSGTLVFAFEQTGIASTGELLFEETAEIEA